MGWIHPEYPDHEGAVVGYVRREGVPSGSELYRELAFPLDDDAAARPADRVAGACRCGWRSSRWSPLAPASYGPFSLLVSNDDQERARRLWKRHLVVDLGDAGRDRALRFSFYGATFLALLDRHPALRATFEADRRELALDLARFALDVPAVGTTIGLDELLREHARALAGATDEDRVQLVADLVARIAAMTRRPDPS